MLQAKISEYGLNIRNPRFLNAEITAWTGVVALREQGARASSDVAQLSERKNMKGAHK